MENGFYGNKYQTWPSMRNIGIYIKFSGGSRYCDLSREYKISPTQVRHICEKIERMSRRNEQLNSFIKDGKIPSPPKYRMSVRTFHVLQANGLVDPVYGINFDELSKMTESELLRIRECGKKTCNEIKEILKQEGLSLKKDVHKLQGPWPSDRDIYIYHMREAGYNFSEIAQIFKVTPATCSNRHLAVKEMLNESILFNQYVFKNGADQ